MWVPLEIIMSVVTVLIIPGALYIWKQQDGKIEELKKNLEKHIDAADKVLKEQSERMDEIENNYKGEFKAVRETLGVVRDEIIEKLHGIQLSCAAFSHYPAPPPVVPPVIKQG